MNPEQRMVREFHDQYLKDNGDVPKMVPDRTLLFRGRLSFAKRPVLPPKL